MNFETNHVFPGVTHIRDEMGVCMTLIEGEKAALLVDTGYGTENVAQFITSLTNKPVTVLLTHNHHDHALGARWFEKTVMFPQDMKEWSAFTGEAKRRVVFGQAISKGLKVQEDDFLSGECRMPFALQEGTLDLGGISVQIIHCPGHTPGSCVVYIPVHKLLLTGDDWNPCTWLFFDAALGVQAYRENLRRLQALPFTHVLCSHQLALYPREAFDAFADHLTDDVLKAAIPVKIGGNEHIDTRQANVAEGQILVFDWAKSGFSDK